MSDSNVTILLITYIICVVFLIMIFVFGFIITFHKKGIKKHRSISIAGHSPAYPLPPPFKGQDVSRLNRNGPRLSVYESDKKQDGSGDFTTSLAIGALTNNAALGGIIGGSFTGGLVGDVMRDGSIGEMSNPSPSSDYSSSYDSSSSDSSSSDSSSF